MTLKLPSGNVKTFRPGSRNPYNIPWTNVTRYEPAFSNAAQEFGVDVYLIVAMAILESDSTQVGERWDNYPQDGPSVGIMQVKPRLWQSILPDADAYTATGNIRLGTCLMARFIRQHGTWQKAIVNAYFPDNDPNGTTQNMYVQTITALMQEMGATETPLATDVLDAIFGGQPYTVSADYGQFVTWSCPGCYDYFAAYGLDTRYHWAIDVAAAAGDGAPLYAPCNGTIVCGGTNTGSGGWNTGCAAFPRVNNYGGKPSGTGAGRLEIMHEDGDRTLILGHVLNSRVRAGDWVHAGDYIGQQGGMNGSHVHVEARYANGTRIGDPRALFGGEPTSLPKAPRVDIPQPAEFDRTWTVTVTGNDVPVLQRADPNASPVAEPLQRGEQFEAAYLTISDSTGKPYWVSKARGRVPAEGTNIAEVLGIETGGKPDLSDIQRQLTELGSDLNDRLEDILFDLTEVSA